MLIEKKSNITIVFPNGKSEPNCVKIINSGWSSQYHVIIENGDVNYTLTPLDELLSTYNLTIDDLPQNDIFCLSKKDILGYPNDADLGEFLRKKIW